MAVRGLSQAVSDSQGWSLHKAILLRSVIKLFKLGRSTSDVFPISVRLQSQDVSLSMKVRHFFFDPLVLEKCFDGKFRFDEDFQTVEVEVKKNSQKFSGPFSPVELAHWEKSCKT